MTDLRAPFAYSSLPRYTPPFLLTTCHFPSLPLLTTCTVLVDDQNGELFFFLSLAGAWNDEWWGLAAELNTPFHMAPEERRR
jgi:hypothetical protein